MEACNLCDPNLAPIISESDYWRLILNKNQDLLGKCFLVLCRHLEAVSLLKLDEWIDLHQQLARTTEVLTLTFSPDHFNYAFLQNQDRHVHLHIIPRYKEPREVIGMVFDDPDYPGHYRVPAPGRYLAQEQLTELTMILHQHFVERVGVDVENRRGKIL
jgi:diadenosine tetraphosphate (Ap4A) HIT family hydrolase